MAARRDLVCPEELIRQVGHEELRHMTVQIRLLFEHRLTESAPEQS